jgi:hypothetical protein
MNTQSERSMNTQLEPRYAVDGIVSAAVEAPATHVSADRLYQVAAFAAGMFLLVTLL